MVEKNNFFSEKLFIPYEAAKKAVLEEIKKFFEKHPGKVIELYFATKHGTAYQYIFKDSAGLAFENIYEKINKDCNHYSRSSDFQDLYEVAHQLKRGFYNIIDMPTDGIGRISNGDEYEYYVIDDYRYNSHDEAMRFNFNLDETAPTYEEVVLTLAKLVMMHGKKTTGPEPFYKQYTFKFTKPIIVNFTERCEYKLYVRHVEVYGLKVITESGTFDVKSVTMFTKEYGEGLIYLDHVVLNKKDVQKIMEIMGANKSEFLEKMKTHQKYMEDFKEEVMSTIKHYVDKYGKETEHGYFVSVGQGSEKLVKCMVKKVSAANYIERRGIEDTPKTRYDLERAYGVSGYDKFSANAVGYDEKGVLCVFGGHGGKCKVSNLKTHELPQLATWVVNMCED